MKKKWLILAVLLMAYFAPNYLQYQLSPISTDIIQGYSISPVIFSRVFSAPMIPAVFLSLLSGVLADKYGPKPVIGISLVISCAGSILRFYSTTYSMLFLSMLMIGVAGAVVNANGVKVISCAFSRDKVGVLTGVFLSSSTIAMSLATGTTSILGSIRAVYLLGVIITIAATLLWFFLAENSDLTSPATPNGTAYSYLRNVVKKRSVIISSITLFFVMSCMIGIASFLPLALSSRGISEVAAGAYTAAFTIGNLIGSLSSPIVDQKWKSTKIQTIALVIIIGSGTIFAWRFIPGFPLLLALITTGAGIGGIMPLMISFPVKSGEISPGEAGISGGIISTLQLLGAILMPSYIIAPITGDNYSLFFLVTGSLMVLPLIIIWLFHK